jgi:hypothetical protein
MVRRVLAELYPFFLVIAGLWVWGLSGPESRRSEARQARDTWAAHVAQDRWSREVAHGPSFQSEANNNRMLMN